MKAAAAAALALLAACRAARADDPGFELRIVVPSEVAPGEAAAVSVTLAPAAGRTIAAEGPLRLALDADDALALPRRRYLRKDAADPAADAPRFDVKLRPKAAGDHRLTIDARFWLCAAKTCRPVTATRAVIIHAPAPPIDAGVDAAIDAAPPVDAGRRRGPR
ncbi:MAG: hypothetical protein IPH44_04875 [Myxococcales bacterium]|nr:hypothetical protein [Myxococcales bacterium]MBK7193715.1 hypothetical protein [Myxococcales bacterium]MBP6849511.1 hypothetical protein [Kofleriaceae bacterium]